MKQKLLFIFFVIALFLSVAFPFIAFAAYQPPAGAQGAIQYNNNNYFTGLSLGTNSLLGRTNGNPRSITLGAGLQLNGDGTLSVTVAGGTVTTLSVTTANGVSGVVANPTTTPAITLTLGAITPSSVNGITFTGSASPSLAVTGTSTVSGTNTGDQDLSGLVPYTGATGNVNLGSNLLISSALRANAAGGVLIESTTGTDIGLLGAGNSSAVTWYGANTFNGATANTIASFNGDKVLTALSTSTYPTLTELSYVKGVTSAVQTQLNSKQASGNYIVSLAGDASATGPGAATLTLATVNGSPGTFGSSTAIPSVAVNGKGLVTSVTTNPVIAPAGTLTGTTLAGNVLNSSLTSVGTLGGLTVTSPITGSVTGNSGTVTIADAGGDTTTFPLLGTTATGNLSPRTDAGLAYNASTNVLTASGFAGALSGNASTATALQNARTINGVSFDGTGNITVPAAAGTLTGTTLANNVVTSSLTSVGTITSGTWNGTVVAMNRGGTGANLSDPGADRIMFWDDSGGVVTWLTAGDGLEISGTTLNATDGGGNVTGPESSTDTAIATWNGTEGRDLNDTAVLIDSSNNMTGINTLTLPNTGLHLLDTNASHDLIIAPGSNLTADHTLTITTGDADRVFTLAGDFTGSGTSSGTNTGDQTTITGNAGTATALQTARAIGIGGTTGLSATGVNFDGTAAINPALTGTLVEANGGTGESTYTDGQLLIGNSAGGLTKAVLTEGSNISITNGDGSITISATGDGATPGGSFGDIQFNSAGSFGGVVGATTDGTVMTLTNGLATTAFSPSSNDGAALGSGSAGWSDAYFATGGVLNWGNGNTTLTHSSGLLTTNSELRFDNNKRALFKGTTDVNPGQIYTNTSNQFIINTESLTYPIYMDGSVINIADNAGTGVVNFGTSGARATIASTGTVFNEAAGNLDLRIEGASDTHLFFADASANAVGISNDTPATLLQLGPIGASAGNTGELSFLELAANGSHYTGFKGADSQAGNTTYVLPNAYPGASGYILSSTDAGVMSWVAPATGTVTSVSGTTDRITSTGGATPVIDIATGYVGQTSITTLGTIGTGTWQGGIIDSAYGGTENGFTKFSGPTTSEKTFTLPNASATILTDNTPVTLSQGGTGASLTDPNADRLLFWDDSAGSVAWLTAGSGLTITDTTITASVPGVVASGSITLAASTSTTITSAIDSSVVRIVLFGTQTGDSGGTGWSIRLGDSGGIENTGYLSAYSLDGAAAVTGTTGFVVTPPNAASFWMELQRVGTTEQWLATWSAGPASLVNVSLTCTGNGAKTTSAATNQMSVIHANGNAGTIYYTLYSTRI